MKNSSVWKIAWAFALTIIPNLASADNASPTIPKILEPQSPISNVCTQIQPTIASISEIIEMAAHTASDAGMNSRGLGLNSPGKHYRSVEDDSIAQNKMLNPALDEISNFPIWLANSPDSDMKQKTLALGIAYDKTLHALRQYTDAAVISERANWGKRNAWGNHGYGLVGAMVSMRNYSDRSIDADKAREILDSEDDVVSDTARNLKLPEFQWSLACNVPYKPTLSSEQIRKQ